MTAAMKRRRKIIIITRSHFGRAVRIELFTARVLCRMLTRIIPEVAINYGAVQGIRGRDAGTVFPTLLHDNKCVINVPRTVLGLISGTKRFHSSFRRSQFIKIGLEIGIF